MNYREQSSLDNVNVLQEFDEELSGSEVKEEDPIIKLSEKAQIELDFLLAPSSVDNNNIPDLNEEEIDNIVGRLVSDNDFTKIELDKSIEGIKKWINTDPNNHISKIEQKLAKYFNQSQETSNNISLSLFALLGEIQQYRKRKFVDDELVENLELAFRYVFTQEVKDQIKILNQSNNQRGNLVLHKILDFMQEYMTTFQDHTEDKIQQVQEFYNKGLFMDFLHFASKEVKNSKNYLIQKHFQDIVDQIEVFDSKKIGAVSGMAGGSTDEIIYTFAHVQEAYRNRVALGINEGYPIANPVLPITPSHLGYYQNGKLEKIYCEKSADDEDVRSREAQYIKQNHPDDEYIYDEINEPQILKGKRIHSTNKLHKFDLIWSFTDRLKSKGRKFFFDISRINMSELHPLVAADFLTINQIYLDEVEGKENAIKPLTEGESRDQLFPLKNFSSDKFYQYENLTKLHMRKKIENDFNINIADYEFWEQRNFLSFLETRSVEDVEKLQEFVKKFDGNGLKSFLSVEYGEGNGEKLIVIGKKLDEKESQLLFKSYSELNEIAVSLSNNIGGSGEWNKTSLPESVKEMGNIQIGEAVLRRAKDMLNVAREITEHGGAETKIYGKEHIECRDIQEVIKALTIYKQALEKIVALFGGDQHYNITPLDHVPGDVESFSFEIQQDKQSALSYMTVQLRERGVLPDQVDRNQAFDGQARVNFLFSDQPIPDNIQDPVRRDALSIRIDREGRIEEGEGVRFDDTLEAGTASLDAGSLFAGKDNEILGRVIALGNSLEAKNSDNKKDPEYFHNRESFSKELGQADVFAKMMSLIQKLIKDRYAFSGRQKSAA